MDITSKRTSISRRPAALSVLVGLSLLGGVPLIASQVVPTAADAMRRTSMKRRALVRTSYTAGGLTAGIVAAGIVAMIARAAGRRRR